MPATFDFIEDPAPAATQFDFQPDAEQGPSFGERMGKALTTEGLPSPIQRISAPGSWQEPAIEVAPGWVTPPWVPAAKLLGYPKVAEAGEAMSEESAKAISGLTSPLNLGLVAATKAYPPLGVAIAASMVPQIYEGGKQAYRGMTTGDIPEIVRGGTKAAIGTAGAVLGTLPLVAKLLPRTAAEAAKEAPPVTPREAAPAESPKAPEPQPVVEPKPEPEEPVVVGYETAEGVVPEKAVVKGEAIPPPLTPTEQAEARADLSAELGEEAQAPVSPEPAPAPETPPVSAAEAKAPEPTPPAKVEAPAAKEPWQMTQKEWELGRIERSGIRGSGSPHTQSIAQVKPKRAADSGDRVMLPDGTIWEYRGISGYAADNANRINGWENITTDILDRYGHKTAVEKAIKEGKPVPPEVLAEYPELAPKPAAKPAAETGKEMGAPKSIDELRSDYDTKRKSVDQLRGELLRQGKAEAHYNVAQTYREKKAILDKLLRGHRVSRDTKDAYRMALRDFVQAERTLEESLATSELQKVEPKPPETLPTGVGMELGMSIIPPQLKRSLKTFAVQDIAPALRAGVNTSKAAKDAIIHAFSPASSAEPRVVDTMFKSKGYAEQVMTQAAAAMEDANKKMRVMPRAEQVAFVDRVKRGQAQPTQELTDLADLMRRWDDYLYSEAQVYKPSLNYLDNHLRVLWKVIPGIAQRGTSQQQILSKRPWRGSQGFTKRHVLDDMSDGIALGGEPVTYNPVEMFLLHAQDVMKFVAANRAWQSLKGTGDVTFVKFGAKAPDDYVRINDSISKAYFSPKGMKGIRAQTGEWWVQKDAARMIENYLSKDLIRNNPIGRALMGIKNATTAIELGLSPFHAVFESLETMGSTFGLGLSKIASGDIVSGLKNVAETPISPKTVSKLGRAGVKYAKNAADFQATEPEAYNWFVSKFPDAARLIDDMFSGGGQIGMHQDYKFRAGTGFRQALQEANYPGAVLRAVPALNAAAMKPLFEVYIPRLKIGTFLREYSFELYRRAGDIAAGKVTREQIARQTWAFVEDRFGEMNFDNLYWDRTFKSALQLLFRSVTWKLGNLRGFGKAARDATAELGWRWFTEGRAPEMTMPMAWALGMSVTTAAVSTLVTKAATGKYPWELAEHAGDLIKNLVFPRISLTDASQRVSTPTYWRDAVHLAHSVPDYVRSSMSGEKGRITDVWNNRDFYGVQVYNPDDPLPRKVAQVMQHLIPVPFGASSWLAAERTGATRGQALSGFFGFTKAPYYISHTAAEQKGLELVRSRMPQGSRTREEFERSIRERQAVEAIKRGDMTVQEAFREGLVDQPRMKQVQKRATEPLLENLVTRLSAEDSIRVYKAAEPEEKDRLKFRLQRKILQSRKTSAEKGQLLVELER